jgi:hypothetical protein
MEVAVMVAAGGLQQFQVKPVVILRMETRLPVIAALGNVLRYAWQMQAGRSWHGRVIPGKR